VREGRERRKRKEGYIEFRLGEEEIAQEKGKRYKE
jgi:hypothetical protein